MNTELVQARRPASAARAATEAGAGDVNTELVQEEAGPVGVASAPPGAGDVNTELVQGQRERPPVNMEDADMAIEPFWRRLAIGGDYGVPAFCFLAGFGVAALVCFALRPGPEPTVPVSDDPAFRRLARDLRDAERRECEALGLVADQEVRLVRQSVLLDELRRGAVWLPPMPADLAAGDRIPPQTVPTEPE